MLLQLPGAIDEQARANFEPHDDWPAIEPVLQEALAAVNKMRIDEGKALLADLAANGQAVEQFLDRDHQAGAGGRPSRTGSDCNSA